MMAARRIQAALSAPQPVKNPYSSQRQPVVIPGWTDGDRTSWRSSVYGASITSPGSTRRYTDSDTFTGGSYSAQGARRAAGIEDSQQRPGFGNSAPQPSMRDFHDKIEFKRTNSSSQLSISSKDESPSLSEESVHPLMNTPLKGRLLIPQLSGGTPTRSRSSTSLTCLVKREPAARSPLGKQEMSSRRHTDSIPNSWSHGKGQFVYPLPSRHRKVEKRFQDVWIPSPKNQSGVTGLGEGRWEKQEVEVEVPEERKRLFLYAH